MIDLSTVNLVFSLAKQNIVNIRCISSQPRPPPNFTTKAAQWRLLSTKAPDHGHRQHVHTAESERYPSAAS